MFNIPTRTRYGIRALIQIALSSGEKPVSLLKISEEQDVSRKYLENIFKLLKKAGIVTSSRGPEGGYNLIKSASELTLYEIFDAIDGPVQTVNCHDDSGDCIRAEKCITTELWKDLLEHIVTYLKSKTLDHLIQEYSGDRWVI